MKQILNFTVYCAILACVVPISSADSRKEDVKEILMAHSKQNFIRCVLNKRPRSLAIHLTPELSVAYDTQLGALAFAWRPSDPKKPIKLNGAVFTGRHGPQPSIVGEIYFEEKNTHYTFSDPKAKLRYLGHKIGSKGTVIVNFAFQDEKGNILAEVSESLTAKDSENDTKLVRNISIKKLIKGASVTILFPKKFTWENATTHSVTLNKSGSKSYSTTVNP